MLLIYLSVRLNQTPWKLQLPVCSIVCLMNKPLFCKFYCGSPVMLGRIAWIYIVTLSGCMGALCLYVISYQPRRQNLCFSNENSMTDFCLCKTWYVGSGGHKYYHVICRYQMPIFSTSAYLFWLANKINKPKKPPNIQSSVWATVRKLGIWVVVGTRITQVVCCHWMRIFDTSFSTSVLIG